MPKLGFRAGGVRVMWNGCIGDDESQREVEQSLIAWFEKGTPASTARSNKSYAEEYVQFAEGQIVPKGTHDVGGVYEVLIGREG